VSSSSFLDLGVGVTYHHEGRGLAPWGSTIAEGTVSGRYDLAGFAPSLAGSFVDAGLGLGIGGTRYGGPVDSTESTGVLLARFGFGFILGRSAAPRAEILLAYDHRHDDFAGGLKMPGLGSGPVGHLGIEATAWVRERWGVRALAQAGSAYLFGLSVLHRTGRVGP
jgi:hypothetical protein